MSEDVGIGGTDGRSRTRTRAILVVFGAAALVAIIGSLALPSLMVEQAVDACAEAGGAYDRDTATCLR